MPLTSPPAGLVACVPWLWRHVLFPGTLPVEAHSPRWHWLLLIVGPALLLYPCLHFHLLEPDEGRYAQIPCEMLQRGDWIVPHLQGEPYLDKPPLLYWLVMLSYQCFGVSAAAARLVPALAVHLTLLIVYGFGRRWLGASAALRGAMLLAVAPGFVGMGRLLILDGLLTLFTVLTLFSAYRATEGTRLHWGWWLLAAGSAGLGTLTKGPIVAVLALAPVVAHRWLAGTGARLNAVAWLTFVAVGLAVNLPWYVAIASREPTFLRYFFWEHHVLRFFAPFDHIQPVWYYVPIALGGLLPATLFLIGLVRFVISPTEGEARSAALGFCLLAGLGCIGLFSLSGSKLPTYILPAFPPFALAAGYLLDRTARLRWQSTAALTVCGLLLAGVHYWVLPWYAAERSPFGQPAILADYCADPDTPIVCYPRHCDSVAFYLGRADLRNVRSKHAVDLVQQLHNQPRTIVLFTHRHSLLALQNALPPSVRVKRSTSLRRTYGHPLLDRLCSDTPWGLCDIAVIVSAK